jgi:hypothetical protein
MRRHTQLWLSSIAVAALMASAGANTWDETANGGGDAGQTPGTAQVVAGNPNDPVTRITGRIADTNDLADVFAIFICDPAIFHAHTGTTTETTFDSKLTLYDSQGRPLWFNDDRPSDVDVQYPSRRRRQPALLHRRRVGAGQLPQQQHADNCRQRDLGTAWSWHILPGDFALACRATQRG